MCFLQVSQEKNNTKNTTHVLRSKSKVLYLHYKTVYKHIYKHFNKAQI